MGRDHTSQPSDDEKSGVPFLGRITERVKKLFKKYGWKLGVAIFLGYLIRDVALYIVLPYLIARSLI